MAAFCLGADALAWRDDTDLILIASVDTYNNSIGAAGILLKSEDTELPFRLTKWSISKSSSESIQKELKKREMSPDDNVKLNKTSSPANQGLYKLIEEIENSKHSGQQVIQIKSEADLNMELDIIIERND